MAHLPDLTTFKALSFDCYGTLINWDEGMNRGLQPILSRLPPEHPWALKPMLAIQRFDHFSQKYSYDEPKLSYDENLVMSLQNVAAEAGVTLSDADAAAIGTGPGRWPAFPDTVAGLLKLKRHFKLVILSNVNNANIARCVKGSLAPVEFDAVYTAENIGSYKPSHQNFEYLFRHAKDELGVDRDKGELLHVARSLTADHVPAKELGLRSVWIARGGDKEDGYGTGGNLKELTEQGKLNWEWKFATIGDFADEVERQFAAK